MSTLQYNGNEYNILYIDSTIASAGDGSTPATALATIPSPLVNKTCYIVRRQEDNETTYVDMPRSWYADIQYIMFLGFPEEDDPMYNLMEADAKTAWGSDTGKYARIRCNDTIRSTVTYDLAINNANNICSFKTNSVRDFYAANCYFYRDGNSGAESNTGQRLGYMFAFDYGSLFASVAFNNCKFGYTQYNLESDDYISNNTDIATDTTKYPQFKCRGYIYGTQVNTFALEKCVINNVFTVTNVSQYHSNYAGAQNVINVAARKYSVSHCQYNVLYRNGYFGDYQNTRNHQSLWFSSGDRGEAIINDLEINQIYTPTGAYRATPALYTSCQDSIITNIKINYKVMGGGNVTSFNTAFDSNATIYIYSRNTLYIDDIIADFSDSGFTRQRMLYIASMRDCVGNPGSKISNLYFKFNKQASTSNYTPVAYIQGEYSSYGSSSVDGDYSNYTTQYTYQTNCSKGWIVDNLVIDAQNNSTSDYVLELHRCGCRSPYINGRIYLSSATLDVDKVYHNVSTVTGINIIGNSYLKCDDFEANLNYPGYNGTVQLSYQRSSGTSIYINRCNCLLTSETLDSSVTIAESNSSLVCPNYIKTGQLFQRNAHCIATSWNTVRTGSNAQGSIKFRNNMCTQENGPTVLIVGQHPYSGIQVVPASIGKKILTAYIATKNFDVTEEGYISGRVGILVNTTEKYQDTYNAEKILTKTHLFTSQGKGWEHDNSNWSGDTNLKSYKVEIPIDVYNLEDPIDVKIWFNWYSVSGYVYVDPDFKLTDAE